MWTMFSSLPGWSADHTQARPELSHSRSPPGEPGVYLDEIRTRVAPPAVGSGPMNLASSVVG
jgi:hypothetical protein